MSLPAVSLPNGSRALRPAIVLLAAIGLIGSLPVAGLAQSEADASDLLREWQLLEYRDADGELQLVPPGIGITMLPFAGKVKGEGACSTFEASYSLAEDTFLIDAPEIETRGCDEASQAIDDAFFQGLTDTRKWSARSSILTLRNEVDDVILTMTRAELPADPTLARWELARLTAADGTIVPAIEGAEPSIEFLRGGRVVGSTGCGSFVGSYTTNDTTISIHDVGARLGDCTDAVHEQAETLLATFPEITDFAVLPAGLVLEDAAGTNRAALVPAIDLGRRTWTPTQVLDDEGSVLYDADVLNTSAVRFAGSSADGRSICRGFEGGSVRSGLAISAFDLEPGTGNCPKPAKGDVAAPQDVEDAFLAALEKAASHALRGSELEIMDVEGRPVLRLQPQEELVGPTWYLDLLDTTPDSRKMTLKAPIGDVPLTAIFEDIGVVQGETGPNAYLADYETPGAAQIRITDADAFGRGCRGRAARSAACVQEQTFLQLLESADSFIVRAEDLRFFKGTRPLLRFVPAQAVDEDAAG